MGNIQMKEVRELKKRWGNKPCDHNAELLKEYHLGAATGDYICSKCGCEIYEKGKSDMNNKNGK